MADANAEKAGMMMASCVALGVSLGTVRRINGQSVESFFKQRGMGDMGPTAIAPYRRDATMTLTFQGSTFVAKGTAKGSIVITITGVGAGKTITVTYTNMKPGGHRDAMDDDAPPFSIEQDFECEDALANDNVTVAFA